MTPSGVHPPTRGGDLPLTGEFSPCRGFRYTLHRRWSPLKDSRVLWVMLNPSTADDMKDDRTIRRCIGLWQAWGFDGLMVGNLYAHRATRPADLGRAREIVDAIGADNDTHLRWRAERASLIVATWGSNAERERAATVTALLEDFSPVYELKHTQGGMPCHPLYLSGELRPVLRSGVTVQRPAPGART